MNLTSPSNKTHNTWQALGWLGQSYPHCSGPQDTGRAVLSLHCPPQHGRALGRWSTSVQIAFVHITKGHSLTFLTQSKN